ncbi:MAG TPA: magnesium transporter [Polyangia bacterium]|nr:magnesium transporter [Polyangia bacterium]
MRVSSLLRPDLEETLRTNPAHAAELADELHASDLAELIVDLDDQQAALMLAALPVPQAAATLDVMDHGRRQQIFSLLDRALAAHIADAMSADERADLFQALPDDLRADLLSRMPKDASKDVRELIRYPETSAGGLMTTDFVALDPNITVERAIDEVRRTAAEKETIYEAYAVDPNDTLLGAVSLRDLVLARAGQPISAIMNADVISVPPDMDQEDVARLFEHYNMLALPVVDSTRKLLGIVTVDDVMTVLKEERAEDIQKLGAVAPTEEPYFKTEFWMFVRKRAGWLIAIFLGEILTASVLEHFEAARKAFTAIEVFVPLIISSGGNTGSQASSLVIRGLALGEFGPWDAFRILWREVRMGLVLGCVLGLIGFARALLVGHSGGGGMASAVGLALVACVTFGSVVGAGLPLLIKRVGLDPAVSSGPFIASLVDVLGIVIYLKIAIFILGG